MLTRLLPWLYARLGVGRWLGNPLIERLYLTLFFAYKRHVEDPFAGLGRRQPELFRGGHILDVGANMGYTATLFARLSDAPFQVFAFEPEPANMARLKRVVASLRLEERITAVPAAVGDAVGEVHLLVNESHPGDHRVLSSAPAGGRTLRVPMVTVDSFVEERRIHPVRFIKIDVQGLELAVSRGLARVLDANAAVAVAFEYEESGAQRYGYNLSDLVTFYRSRGFALHALSSRGELLDASPEIIGQLHEQRGYVDLLAVREGEALKQTLELLTAAAVSAVLTIAYLIYVGRTLGPAEYAQFAAALALVYFFAIVFGSLMPAIARTVARRTARGEQESVPALRTALLRPIVKGVAIAAVALVLPTVVLARLLRFDSIAPPLLGMLAGLCSGILSADRGVLQGLLRFRAYNAGIVLESLVRLALAVVLVGFVGRSATNALIAYVAAIVATELLNHALFKRPTQAMSVEWSDLLRLAGPMVLLLTSAAVLQNIDMLAVKRWFPADDAGRYGAAVAVARVVGVIFVPLYALIGPTLAHRQERGQPIVGAGLRITGMFVVLSGAAGMALYVWAEDIIAALFGAPFASGAWIAAHLAAISGLMHVSILLAQILITVRDFVFVPLFGLGLVTEIAALGMFHSTIAQVLITLYVAQIVVLLPLLVAVIRHSRRDA